MSRQTIFGNFNDQTIPPNYYNILNDDNDYGNNITGTPIKNSPLDKKGLEDVVMLND